MYQNFSWLKIVGNVGIYISLTLIFYSTIYSFIIKDFRKNYKLAQDFLTSSEYLLVENSRRNLEKQEIII